MGLLVIVGLCGWARQVITRPCSLSTLLIIHPTSSFPFSPSLPIPILHFLPVFIAPPSFLSLSFPAQSTAQALTRLIAFL